MSKEHDVQEDASYDQQEESHNEEQGNADRNQEQRQAVIDYLLEKSRVQNEHQTTDSKTMHQQIKESIVSELISNDLSDSNKAQIAEVAKPVMHDPENIEAVIEVLETASLTSTKEEVKALLGQDKVVAAISREQQALGYTIDMAARPKEQRQKIQKKMKQSVTNTHHVAQVHNVVENRMLELNTLSAAAAGDNFQPKLDGLWIKGLYATNKQKDTNSPSSGNSIGVSLGADIEMNNDNIFGIAYSNVSSNSKYSKDSEGNKFTAKNHMLSIYGIHHFNDNLSLNSIFSASMGDINSKRVIDDVRRAWCRSRGLKSLMS